MNRKNRTESFFTAITNSSLRYVAACICATALVSCAARTHNIVPVADPVRDPVATSVETQELTITLFGVDKETNPQRWTFYKDFSEKRVLPLKIEINNPSLSSFTLNGVQYAICDPDYNRVRRMQAKQMALSKVEIMTEKKPTIATKLAAFWNKRKFKKEFESVEFTSQVIPPQSVVRGWLYFQLTDTAVSPAEFYSELKGYQLEIAHIKNTDTNVVANAYIALDAFLKMLHE